MQHFRTAYRRAIRNKLHIRSLAFILKTLFVIIFFLYISHWVTGRSAVQIREVTVEGVHVSDASTIESIAHEFLATSYLFGTIERNNRLLYPKQEILTRAKATNGWIKDVAFSIDGKTLTLSVTEYTPSYLWCGGVEQASEQASESYCYYSDDRGYIFAQSPGYSGSPYFRFVTDLGEAVDHPYGNHVLPEHEFTKVLGFRRVLSENGYEAHSVESLDNLDYRFRTNLPWDIIWNSQSDMTESVERLKVAIGIILKEMKAKPGTEYREIDLRFGDKVFYR